MRKQRSWESSDPGDSTKSFSVCAVCLIVELVVTDILKWKGHGLKYRTELNNCLKLYERINVLA